MLELPAPKPGAEYATGFEHAEFVIAESFATFRARYPQLAFREGGDPILNPELALRLGAHQAKFHYAALDRVIELEEARITDVIFDFDGTLVDSRKHIHEINRRMFSEALAREVTLEESVANYHAEFTRLFDAFGVHEPAHREAAALRWGEIAADFHAELFEGASGMLRELDQAGFRLHLWTARDEGSARRMLDRHGITRLFRTLSFSTAFTSKPEPESLNFDWRSAGPNRVLMIGDSTTDIVAAKNTSALRAAALWDGHSRPADLDQLIATGAELFFHQLSEFRDWMIRQSPN